jgi:hypothetical protein
LSSLADIRAGLKANMVAAGITTQVNLYTTSSPNPPCFELDVATTGVTYDLAMHRGLDQVDMIVRLVHPESESAAQTVDSFIDGAASTDVRAAIETDLTLGGAASACHVTGVQPRRWKSETGGGVLIGAEWTVTVYPIGTS